MTLSTKYEHKTEKNHECERCYETIHPLDRFCSLDCAREYIDELEYTTTRKTEKKIKTKLKQYYLEGLTLRELIYRIQDTPKRILEALNELNKHQKIMYDKKNEAWVLNENKNNF